LQSTEILHDVIIVGSGPSGIGASFGCTENGISPLLLDVGYTAGDIKSVSDNLYEYRKKNDAFHLMVGNHYEIVHHVLNKKSPSPKLSSPYMQFVTKDAEDLSPVDDLGSSIIQSFSRGGLANAWGAALYRCLDDELNDLPLDADELEPYYDRLTEEIGISGDDDDLTPFLGSTKHLLKPIRLSRKAETLYRSYKKKRNILNKKGVYLGNSRVGVLSQDYNGREACDYNNLEMWIPNLPYLYTPAFTLDKLVREGKLTYQDSTFVQSWSRENNYIVVHAENVGDKKLLRFKCKKLVLAAGAINTSKIVLNTKKDFSTRLPLLDNSLVQIPLIMPQFIGRPLDKGAFALTNLNAVFLLDSGHLKLQASIIELTSPARSVFYDMLPFAARSNIDIIKYFVPSLLILFLYFPADNRNSGHLMLKSDNRLDILSIPGTIDRSIIKHVTQSFNTLGAYTHPLLAKPPAHSIHYGGTLPMTDKPCSDYQCNARGELYGEKDVYVADGSLFSSIPSKNFSLTLMANAMRITDMISDTLK
jgi:choline dehydrogenase-like flavoprotein